MSKRIHLISLAALMIVAVSCKKNAVQNADSEHQNPSVAIGQSPDITRIINFNKDVTARRSNPGLKTHEVIPLDEAKDNIADLFNAVYGEPTEYYGETEHAEFTVTMAVDDDGNVLLDDAVAAYEELVSLARENYHASALENKGYICMSATVEQQRGGNGSMYQSPYEVVDLEIQGKDYNSPKRILHEYNVSYGQIQYVSQAQLQGPNNL